MYLLATFQTLARDNDSGYVGGLVISCYFDFVIRRIVVHNINEVLLVHVNQS